ncbi:MAG TPA: phage tail protein [Ilumatobacter sp.]
MRRHDWLVQQLPVGMVDDDFLVRFLSIFQTVSDTVLHQVDTLSHMFDPTVAPDPMVRLMGRWIGIDWIDPSLDDELQRTMVLQYAELLQWRGTRRGMQLLLETISGAPAVVVDSGGVYHEGEAPAAPPHVRLEVESTGWADVDDLIEIVKAEVPATVTFELRVAGRTVWPTPPPAGGAEQTSSVEVG